MGLAFAADVPLMASTFCNRYGQRRLRMGSEPPAEEWEPRGRVAETLYVPRRAIEGASIQSGSLLLRSAGQELRITLRSRRTAAAASAWSGQMLSDHDRSGTGS